MLFPFIFNIYIWLTFVYLLFRHVARKCNPKQPRLNSMTMVRNLKCGYMVFLRLVEEKAPEMAEQIMKTIQSDYSGLEIWNRQ